MQPNIWRNYLLYYPIIVAGRWGNKRPAVGGSPEAISSALPVRAFFVIIQGDTDFQTKIKEVFLYRIFGYERRKDLIAHLWSYLPVHLPG